MDENKHPNQSKENQKGTPKPEIRTEAPVKSRRIFAKRWAYPAIYLGAAALIIGLMYVKSQTGTSPVVSQNADDGTTANPTAAAVTFRWPVADPGSAKVTLGFFNAKGTADEQAKELVNYDNGFYPHQGIDIKTSSQNPFAVVAAANGKVTQVQDNKLLGKTITVQSANGYVEQYQSLSDAKVKVGQAVNAGDVIGTAGSCEFEKSQGVHVYFQVTQNGNPVDPASLLPKA